MNISYRRISRCDRNKSKWDPRRLLLHVDVADADALAPADAKSHRCQDDVARAVVIRADASDKIETAVDAREPLKQTLDVRQVVD